MPSYGQSKKDSVLPKIDSLKAVVVRPKELRPKFNGDTTEYNTGSIQLRVNANVEELLVRLPGLHIDANGTITYNGEVIQQLLVDGENIFGSNPTLVTRNFDASRIAKVQLLDRQSEHTRFTGIDDGTRVKTLNLVLKEDSKKGYFGKVSAGAGDQGLYSVDALFGDFHKRQQIAGLGLTSNTGSTSVSSSAGGISNMSSSADDLGASAGQGVPSFKGVALHYANSWAGSDDHLNGDYQYGNVFTQPVTTTRTIQTLPDSVYTQNERAQSVNRQSQHWAYGVYQWQVDSASAFRFAFNYSNATSNNLYSDTALSAFNDTTVNRTNRKIESVGDRNSVTGAIGWRIKSLRNQGRVFSIEVGTNQVSNNTNGFLFSLNRFYSLNGDIASSDTVDQRKQIGRQTHEIHGSLSFTQSLWNKNLLGFSYEISGSAQQTTQYTFERGEGKYQELVDSLSSHLSSHTTVQKTALFLQGNSPVFRYFVSAGLQEYSFEQKDIMGDSTSKYNYLNFLPRVMLNFTPNHNTRISLDYSLSATLPGLTQLQAIKNNNDPLHVTLGNPNLKPGSGQNWKLGISRSGIWLYNLSVNFGTTSNSISTKTTIDSLGRQNSQPMNVDGGRNMGLYFSLHRKIAGFDMGMSSNVGYARSLNFVNADLNRNDNYTSGGGLSIARYVPEKYSFQLETRLNWFDTRSSVNQNPSIHYLTQAHNASLSLFFIPGFELNTNANYSWQQSSSIFSKNTSVLLWNASIGHNFLSNRLAAKVIANNLLNQSAGISRTNLANVNTESYTNILGRYWLLTFSWRFEHKYKTK